MDVNPIILERESSFSNKWLSLFSFNEVIEYFDEIESIEVKMESLKEEIINDLEDLIGETSGDIKLTLINLKRNLYNNRKIKLPENTTSLDSHEAWSNIKREIKKGLEPPHRCPATPTMERSSRDPSGRIYFKKVTGGLPRPADIPRWADTTGSAQPPC